MPKKKDYPKWFSYHFKPYPPTKPIEFNSTEEILSVLKDNYASIRLEEFPEGTKSIYIEGRSYEDYGGTSVDVTVTFYGEPKLIKNPNYDKLLKKYNQDYEDYKIQLKEWEKYKKKWDEEIKTRKRKG